VLLTRSFVSTSL